jgi:hypothetical protein
MLEGIGSVGLGVFDFIDTAPRAVPKDLSDSIPKELFGDLALRWNIIGTHALTSMNMGSINKEGIALG